MATKHVEGRVRRYRKEITLESQGAGTIDLFTVPAGAEFAYGVVTTDTSLGSTTIAVGISGTAAKYKAAGTFTATNTPTLFGMVSAMDDGGLSANEDVILTTAAAALPASGTLVVDMYFTNA